MRHPVCGIRFPFYNISPDSNRSPLAARRIPHNPQPQPQPQPQPAQIIEFNYIIVGILKNIISLQPIFHTK
jgi:hypothetical protein